MAAGGATDKTLDAGWLKDGALPRLLAVLDTNGEEARAVGGAVRNALLGEPVHEIDVATTATPEAVTRRVTAAGFKAVPTGIAHGTVTVVIDGAPYEVTTLRRDVETFGRHATVEFGRDWEGDARRRDFTINALSATRYGRVYDYTGGLADLGQRRVRFIGEAKARIEEDYLRILRFFRFHAAYGAGEPDADGVAACIAARAGLAQLSRERVRMEVMKLLAARRAVPALEVMAEIGLLLDVLGGVPNVVHAARMAEIEQALALPADPVRRLAALAVAVAEDAERLWQRLRLANKEYERLAGMAEGWRRISPDLSEQAQRVLIYRLGPDLFADQALLGFARAQVEANDAPWRALATLPQRWSAPAFPLKAADFIKRGVAQGPALGAALRAAESAWLAADFPSDAAAIARIADQAAKS